MERQMAEIAETEGASKEQVDQAMKLARAVLNKKQDETTVPSSPEKTESAPVVEEEELD